MALSRNFLKALGLNEEQVNSIVEAHTETISGIRDELKTAKERANKLETVEKEFNDLKAKNAGTEDFKTRYEAEHTAFEKYKSEVTAKESREAKRAAIDLYFEGNNIVGDQKKIAMRAVKAEVDEFELDDKGQLKDTSTLDELIKGDLAGLVSKTRTEGAGTSNPPVNVGGNTFESMSLADKMKFANEHPNDAGVKAFLGK